MTPANATKSERVNLRLPKAAKRRIEQAAAFEGKTVSGFIVSSALANAEKAIQENETMALARRDAKRFFDIIVNPTAPNDNLLTALDEHGKRVASR
ncbi:MAG: DUF1778 domain-containing protein [Chloroflexota bacterium]|nr:DUF1778 domain-containing protein [Chloroflexota bacterium]